MKQIKIFPKDWLQLHPYKQSTPVDSYYTSIANRIYDFLIQTELVNSFEGDEAKQISIRLAAYFEDVISELGIWRTFITTHKALYGKYLPFYTPDDHYYDDEVNFEDVRFLLWHYTQQYHGYRKGTFVSPDNPVNEWTARLIYQLFCDEWTTAPENTRMKKLFSAETRYDTQETYESFLIWFHYDMYLLTDSNQELKDQTQALWQEHRGSQENISNLIMSLHQRLAYTGKTAFLSFTSPQWLAKVMPEDHPDIAFIREIAESSQTVVPEEIAKKNCEDYGKFQQAAEGKLLLYFDKLTDAEAFITQKIGINLPDNRLPKYLAGKKLALYATEQEGVQILGENVECIKDEHNPFYDEQTAASNAIAFFIVKHGSVYLLKELEERGMLADAQAKSLISPERSKAIVHENWQFLVHYFLRANSPAV